MIEIAIGKSLPKTRRHRTIIIESALRQSFPSLTTSIYFARKYFDIYSKTRNDARTYETVSIFVFSLIARYPHIFRKSCAPASTYVNDIITTIRRGINIVDVGLRTHFVGGVLQEIRVTLSLIHCRLKVRCLLRDVDLSSDIITDLYSVRSTAGVSCTSPRFTD